MKVIQILCEWILKLDSHEFLQNNYFQVHKTSGDGSAISHIPNKQTTLHTEKKKQS